MLAPLFLFENSSLMMRNVRFFGAALVAGSILGPFAPWAQGLDLEQGLRIFQQIQGATQGQGQQQPSQASPTPTPTPEPVALGGAPGLARRITGQWQNRPRTAQTVAQVREFDGDGDYLFREGDRILERGRWEATDGETLLLRPSGNRSPARLLILSVDRTSAEMIYEADARNDAQPQRWYKVVDEEPGEGQNLGEPIRPLPTPSPSPRPSGTPAATARPATPRPTSTPRRTPVPTRAPARPVPNGTYIGPDSIRIEVQGQYYKRSDARGAMTSWRPLRDIRARYEGEGRVIFHLGGEDLPFERTRSRYR